MSIDKNQVKKVAKLSRISLDDKNLESYKRNDILARINFASPYIELPKKLTVRQNLEVYSP